MNKIHSTFGALLVAAAGCSSGPGPDTSLSEIPQALQVVCAAPSSAQGSEWTCPDSVSVDCSAADSGMLRVVSPSTEVCDATMLSLDYEMPLTPGKHAVSVRGPKDELLCTSQALVSRGEALRLVAKHVSLWPPNHKLHEIRVEDCVEIVGACPGEKLKPRFIWASSDEPEDALGDGHFAPDITLSSDCQELSLRSERQGPSDGRVYSLGVRVVDASGKAYEGSCTVSVDHDQSGKPASTGPDAYRLNFDGKTPGFPGCVDDSPSLL